MALYPLNPCYNPSLDRIGWDGDLAFFLGVNTLYEYRDRECKNM